MIKPMINWTTVAISSIAPLTAVGIAYWRIRHNDMRHFDERLEALERKFAWLVGRLGLPPGPPP